MEQNSNRENKQGIKGGKLVTLGEAFRNKRRIMEKKIEENYIYPRNREGRKMENR